LYFDEATVGPAGGSANLADPSLIAISPILMQIGFDLAAAAD
jgi:hypothetical protein